jgi:hypothetical protein
MEMTKIMEKIEIPGKIFGFKIHKIGTQKETHTTTSSIF